MFLREDMIGAEMLAITNHWLQQKCWQANSTKGTVQRSNGAGTNPNQVCLALAMRRATTALNPAKTSLQPT